MLQSDEDLHLVLDYFAGLDHDKILVHGGGPQASLLSQKLGVAPQMNEGRRITDDATLEIVTMVYGGLLNKNLAALLQSKGVNAMGVSGADGDLIRAQKRPVDTIDYGWAGDIQPLPGNDNLKALLVAGFTPVFCSLTHDGKGQLLNTNADTIAAHLTKLMGADHEVTLAYCFDMPGVLSNPKDLKSIIEKLNQEDYIKLKQSGQIAQGMIPKLDNAFAALHAGAHQVILGNAQSLSAQPLGGTTLCIN